jgi:hypothetical protein
LTLDIPALRLHRQRIARPSRTTPAGIVRHLGAVQAQEYPFAKWALALRLAPGATDDQIEQAFADGSILRTHVMRPTWHFVAAEDIGWMQRLTAPRVRTAMSSYLRPHGMDAKMLHRCLAIFERALEGGTFLTRVELGQRLARARISLTPMQLGFVAMHAEIEAVICSGPRRGKQFTYALIGERAPYQRQLTGDEALEELTRRFLRSHGPATVRDYVWWSGLKTADARRGMAMAAATSAEQDGVTYWSIGREGRGSASGVHLLPIYDEYLVSYRDRVAVPHGPSYIRCGSTLVGFRHALVIDGQVAGTWRPHPGGNGLAVVVTPMRQLSRDERRGIDAAVARYGRFLNLAVSVAVTPR